LAEAVCLMNRLPVLEKPAAAVGRWEWAWPVYGMFRRRSVALDKGQGSMYLKPRGVSSAIPRRSRGEGSKAVVQRQRFRSLACGDCHGSRVPLSRASDPPVWLARALFDSRTQPYSIRRAPAGGWQSRAYTSRGGGMMGIVGTGEP
jgi:hypothetical protein